MTLGIDWTTCRRDLQIGDIIAKIGTNPRVAQQTLVCQEHKEEPYDL